MKAFGGSPLSRLHDLRVTDEDHVQVQEHANFSPIYRVKPSQAQEKKPYCYKFTDIMLSQLGDSLSRLLHDYACSGIRSGKKSVPWCGIVILNLTRAKPF